MTKPSTTSVANSTLQVYALLFLILGGGLGAALGYAVGASSDGTQVNLTVVPATNDGSGKSFNWLFFEIGMAAGLIACAVLLAASIQTRFMDGES